MRTKKRRIVEEGKTGKEGEHEKLDLATNKRNRSEKQRKKKKRKKPNSGKDGEISSTGSRDVEMKTTNVFGDVEFPRKLDENQFEIQTGEILDENEKLFFSIVENFNQKTSILKLKSLEVDRALNFLQFLIESFRKTLFSDQVDDKFKQLIDVSSLYLDANSFSLSRCEQFPQLVSQLDSIISCSISLTDLWRKVREYRESNERFSSKKSKGDYSIEMMEEKFVDLIDPPLTEEELAHLMNRMSDDVEVEEKLNK